MAKEEEEEEEEEITRMLNLIKWILQYHLHCGKIKNCKICGLELKLLGLDCLYGNWCSTVYRSEKLQIIILIGLV